MASRKAVRRRMKDGARANDTPVNRRNLPPLPGDVERSPAGDARERSVPCARCSVPTFNHSRYCDSCRALAADHYREGDDR